MSLRTQVPLSFLRTNPFFAANTELTATRPPTFIVPAIRPKGLLSDDEELGMEEEMN